MSETKDKRSLAALLAQSVTRQVGGVELEFTPMGWDTAVQALEKLGLAISSVPALPGSADEVAAVVRTPEQLHAWLAWAGFYREDVAAFLQLATGFDLAELKQLPPTRAVEMFIAVAEVNADFFLQNLPSLSALVVNVTARLRDATQQAGLQTSSQNSSQLATSSAS